MDEWTDSARANVELKQTTAVASLPAFLQPPVVAVPQRIAPHLLYNTNFNGDA